MTNAVPAEFYIARIKDAGDSAWLDVDAGDFPTEAEIAIRISQIWRSFEGDPDDPAFDDLRAYGHGPFQNLIVIHKSDAGWRDESEDFAKDLNYTRWEAGYGMEDAA